MNPLSERRNQDYAACPKCPLLFTQLTRNIASLHFLRNLFYWVSLTSKALPHAALFSPASHYTNHGQAEFLAHSLLAYFGPCSSLYDFQKFDRAIPINQINIIEM